jgi:hypothetical protein
MAISSINASIPQTQTAHAGHARHGSHSTSGSSNSSTSSTAQSTAGESLEQLAQQGDPVAIAELKQLQAEQTPNAAKPGQETVAQQAQHGATEPGKGEQFDQYA